MLSRQMTALEPERAEGACPEAGPTSAQIFGAVFSLQFIVVVKTQLTALLFEAAHVSPNIYSFYTCIVTCLLLVPIFLLKPGTWGVPSKEMCLGPTYVFPLIVAFTTFDLCFTNIALSLIAIALQQCIAATNPFWTGVFEALLNNKWQHWVIYLAVTGVVIGAIVAGIDQMKVGGENVSGGLLFALLAVLCSSSKGVFTHASFKKFKGTLSPLALLFWIDLLMMPIILAVPAISPLWSGELAEFLSQGMDAVTFWQMTGIAAIGGARALAQMVLFSMVTATSTSIANIGTQMSNVIISMMWQHVAPTPTFITGLMIVFTSIITYTNLKMNTAACGGIMLEKKDDKSEPLAQP